MQTSNQVQKQPSSKKKNKESEWILGCEKWETEEKIVTVPSKEKLAGLFLPESKPAEHSAASPRVSKACEGTEEPQPGRVPGPTHDNPPTRVGVSIHIIPQQLGLNHPGGSGLWSCWVSSWDQDFVARSSLKRPTLQS